MNNQQIIEEIDIIVRAKVEEARKEIQKVAKETATMARDVANNIKQMDSYTSSFDKLKQGVSQAKNQLKNLNEEMKNIKNSKSNIEQVRQSIENYKEKMKELKNFAGDSELEGLNPYSLVSFKEGIQLLANQITESIPLFSDFRTALEQNLNGDLGDSLLQQLASATVGFKNKFNELVATSKEKVEEIKNSVVGKLNDLTEPIKEKLHPIVSVFNEIGKFAIANFDKARKSIKKMADTTGTPINKLKQLISHFKRVKDESDKTSKSGNNFGNSFGKSLENGIGKIKKFALSLLGIRTAFTAVTRAANAYLSFDTELSANIQNSWNTLGSLLAPALEYVASLFSKLTSIIATFVKALTGIDLVARANAKALNNQAKATKSAASASKQLSSIDDIDNLSSGSGAGGGGVDTPTITDEDVDITPFEKFFNKVKDIFSKIFDPFKEAWENVGTNVFDSLKSMIENLGELGISVGGSLLEVWTNGTGQEIIENMLLGFQQIFDIIGGIANALTHAWNNAGNGTSIIQHIADIFKDIQKFTLDIGDSIKQWVLSDGFQEALNAVFDIINDIFGIIEDVANWILKMYEKYLKPVIDDKLLPAINEIIIAIGDVWKAIKPVVDNAIKIIKNSLEPVIAGLCQFIGGVIDVVKGIAKFISGVFTGDWKKAWNGIKDIFQGVWDMLASIVKTPINLILAGVENLVNAIIKGFNFVKNSLNKISFDVPTWVPIIGGKKWGFNLETSGEIKLPRLATGDVAYEPTNAIIAEYPNARQNPEIVSPVSMMKQSFRDVLSEFDVGGARFDKLCVNVAGKNFFDEVIDYINDKITRNGVSVFKEE